MGVRPGYKRTEVGVIPDDWDCLRICDLARLESGHTPKRTVSAYWNGTIPWVSLHDTDSLGQNYIYETAMSVTQQGIDNSSARLLPCGTVVFSRTATVGKATILGREMATSQDFANYVCGPRLYNLFVVYLFRGMARRWERLMAGSTHQTIYMPTFEKLQIPVPPLFEQKAIATALADIDRLLDELNQLIAKKRDLKLAAMQQLLTGTTRLPGFRGEWQVQTLKQVAEITTGINKPLSQMGYGALYVTVQDLYDGTSIQTSGLSRIRVSPTEITMKALVAGDIVFGKSSVKRDGIGYPSRFVGCGEPVVFSGFTYRARARRGSCDATYLFYALRSEMTRRWLIDNSQASALTNINQTIADAIPIKAPPTVREQTAIAAVLSDIDAELAALEARRQKTQDLKQAMMQELLIGKTRLVRPETAHA